jgi:hypothetical protein
MSSPVTNEATICVIMVLFIIFGWTAELVEVQGTFVCGAFEEGEQLCMKLLHRFEEFYPVDMLIFLLKMLYVLKQAAMAF